MTPNHHTVSAGPYTARLWKATDGRWKWHTYEAGKRILCSAADFTDAKRRAAEHLRALRDGRTALLDADAVTVSEFIAWRDARIKSPLVADAAKQYLKHLESRGVKETRIIKPDLEKFAAAHPRKMAEISAQDVSGYLGGLPVGPRRKNNVRSHLVALWRWARMQGLVPDTTTTTPERTHPAKLDKHEVEILAPDQFRELLDKAPPEWRLALAIGGLAGLRTEEIAGLRWEDLQNEQGRILVRAEICKTGRRRFVPILPSLAAWVAVSKPQPGNMVAPRIGLDALVKRLKRRGGGWVRNGLRHSFGSYRAAVVKSAGQVALEMGNSEAIVRRHYLEVQPIEIAKQWFLTAPPTGSTVVRSSRKKPI